MPSIIETLADAPRSTSVKTRETVEEAAARLELDAENTQAVKLLTGMPFEEIVAVDVTDDGPVITDNRGHRLIFRGKSNPDANGNTGCLLMEWNPPVTEADVPPQLPPVPVFAPFVVDEDEPEPKPKRSNKSAD